jgi:hypothetical protein
VWLAPKQAIGDGQREERRLRTRGARHSPNTRIRADIDISADKLGAKI